MKKKTKTKYKEEHTNQILSPYISSQEIFYRYKTHHIIMTYVGILIYRYVSFLFGLSLYVCIILNVIKMFSREYCK